MATRHLPPLNAVRAFEAAARHMSFKHAADELCITPAAVSHRIRALEEWLGVRLFNRLTRTLELTKEGEAFAPSARDAFALLADGADAISQSREGGELAVSTTMSFASNWLTPKLPRFYEQHEAFSLRIEGADQPVDFNRSRTDVAIRYGEGDYDGLHAELLFTDRITPVCAPALAERISAPADLLALPRLDYQWSGFGARDPSWAKWFRAAGVPRSELGRVPVFSEEHMVLTQAIAGRGIALVGIVAAAEAIMAGTLVRPIPVGLENRSYYFVCPPHALHLHKVEAFRDWIVTEAAAFDAAVAGHPKLRLETVVRSADL